MSQSSSTSYTLLRFKLRNLWQCSTDASLLFAATINRNVRHQGDELMSKTERKGEKDFGPNVQKDLLCSICLCIFTNPVTLRCGHNFCKTCVQQNWVGKISRKCPVCDYHIPETPPPINFNLKSLSENYTERSQIESSVSDESYQVRMLHRMLFVSFGRT